MSRRATCDYCAKEMAVHVPRGGDGTVDVFPAHPRGTDQRCWGSYDREVGNQHAHWRSPSPSPLPEERP